MVRRALASFWKWYEEHYVLNVSVALGLFLLQLVHLFWLTSHVVALRLLGQSFFSLHGIWEALIVLVDYMEIPALLSVSLIYIHDFQKNKKFKSLFYLFLLNVQWLHLFWITDEFVVDQFFDGGAGTVLPLWLAWLAIFIDYLELPVIVDTIRRLIRSIRTGQRIELPS